MSVRVILTDGGCLQFVSIYEEDIEALKAKLLKLTGKSTSYKYDIYNTDDVKYTDVSQFRDNDRICLKINGAVDNINDIDIDIANTDSILSWNLIVGDMLIGDDIPIVRIESDNSVSAGPWTFTNGIKESDDTVCYFVHTTQKLTITKEKDIFSVHVQTRNNDETWTNNWNGKMRKYS